MKQISRALAFILALLPVFALAQSAPATLPYHTVYGRIGATPGDTGPGQAIPFATLRSQLNVSAAPYVILATGQSNFVRTMAYSWTPSTNATVWNNTLDTDGSIGTAFTPIPNATVNITSKIASDIATNTTRPVCLINISYSGMAISHWLSGTGAPDVYQNILSNMPAALAACGATKIDLFLWWQGEADTGPLNKNYNVNFGTMMSRFWTNTWFPQETPVMIHGIASTAISANADGDHMNGLLLGVVNGDPDKRRFVYTAALSTSTYWDVTLAGHMTGQGYFSAGAMSASAFLNGPGRNSVKNMVVDPASGTITFGFPGFTSASMAGNYNGFGATLPATGANWQIGGVNGTSAYQIIDAFGNFTNYVGRRSNGTLAAPTALAQGDLITGLGAQGYDGTAYSSANVSGFNCYANEIWTTAHHGTYCSILNTAPNTITAAAESLRVGSGYWQLFGTTSGSVTFKVPAAAGSNTITWPAGTTDFSATGGTSQVVKQTTAGGAFTVGQLTLSDFTGLGTGVGTALGNPVNGTGNMVLSTSPALTTPSLGAATATTINGAALDNNAWVSYTPTVTASVGTFTTVSATGRSKTIGKTVFVEVEVTVTTAGTAASLLQVTLPTAAAAFGYYGVSKEHNLTGKSGVAAINPSGAIMFAADSTGTTFIANGALVGFGMTYEIP